MRVFDQGHVLTAALATLIALPVIAKAEKPRPHVLFIAVDDLRPELGCYGVDAIQSPHIDRLASDGMRFTRAYCQVPVCGASRASLMTGLRPTAQRFKSYKSQAQTDAPGVTDIPSWFKQHGYETFGMGKIYHTARDNRASWTEYGSPLITTRGFGDYKKPESRDPKGRKSWGGGAAYERADRPDDDYFTGQLAKAAIARLREMKASKQPGFLAVGFTKPHLPFVAPERYWERYDREKLGLATNPFRPKDVPDRAIHNFGELRGYRDIPKGKAPIPDELALTLKHGYYACVTFTDAMVGRILAAVDELGMRENTIVILWGDHGWQLGEHTLWCKHANFNTSLQVPLIIRAPGIKTPGASDALVEFVDIYPTLCELAGLPLPEHLEGRSMTPLLKDPARAWKTAVFGRYHAGESVRTDRYLYTEWRKGADVTARMLYDHDVDPMENVNIAETEHGKLIAARLSTVLNDGWKPVAKAIP